MAGRRSDGAMEGLMRPYAEFSSAPAPAGRLVYGLLLGALSWLGVIYLVRAFTVLI